MAHPVLLVLLAAVVVASLVETALTAPQYVLSLILVVFGALVLVVVRGHNGLVLSAVVEILAFASVFVPAATVWSAGAFGGL